MKKTIVLLGIVFLILNLTGCEKTESNIAGQGSAQEKLIEIAPEEWQEYYNAAEYCRALDYFDIREEEQSECIKNQLSWGLYEKIEKYSSPEQQALRDELVKQEEIQQKNNYNLPLGSTAILPRYKEVTLVSLGWSEENRGILIQVKIKNLMQVRTSVENEKFFLKDTKGNLYSPSKFYSDVDLSFGLEGEKEITIDILYELEPEEAEKIIGVEFGSSASWI